ncbi:MAG: hypothetical protein UIK35_08815 [Coprococcus catus]|nr:hypothetical protein [Coprococcus catus]
MLVKSSTFIISYHGKYGNQLLFAKAERIWDCKNIKLVEYIPCCALKAEIWLRTEILGGFVSRRKEQIFENICTFKNINGIIGVKHQKCGKISLMNEEK